MWQYQEKKYLFSLPSHALLCKAMLYIALYILFLSLYICIPEYMYFISCVCVLICIYIPVYVFGRQLPSKEAQKNETKEISFFLAFYTDLMLWSLPPDIGAKMKPWATVGYHTDTKCLEFQALMLSPMLTVHALILLVSPAFCLGWSCGYASWKVLPRMRAKALLGVRKSLPGNLWWATPKSSCSQVLAQLSLPSPWHLTFCQRW